VAGDLTAAGSTLNLGASFTNVPGGTASWTFTGGTNYNDQSGSAAIVINKATATVTVTGYTGTYDAAAHGATGSAVGVGTDSAAAGSTLNLGATFTNVPGGTASWAFNGGNNYNSQSGSVAIIINKAASNTVITFVNSPPYVYKGSPFTAVANTTGVGLNVNNSPIYSGAGAITCQDVGTCTASYTYSGLNHSSSSASATITIVPDVANCVPKTGQTTCVAYTGSLYAWTPTATSNTATIPMAAVIQDDSAATPGDIRTAKIGFGLRSSTGAVTPISGAQNLAVGLVTPGNLSMGSAAVSIQFSLSASDICNSFTVVVLVNGNYKMSTAPWYDTEITVCRSVAGSIVSNPTSIIENAMSAGMSGGMLGATDHSNSSVNFDISFNKSRTNPQGKVKLEIQSNRNSAGVIDGIQHTYLVTTNAISSLNVGAPGDPLKANFSAKCNVVELVLDPATQLVTAVSLDSGALMQLSVSQTNQTLGITISKSKANGGLWYSNNLGPNGVTVDTLVKNSVAAPIRVNP
jgi:hypothetical protein